MEANSAIDTKEKPFICFCGASFTRSDLLRRHEKLVHTIPTVPEDVPTNKSSTTSFPLIDFAEVLAEDALILDASINPGSNVRGISQGFWRHVFFVAF
jgi:hypothetical protein